MVSRSLNSCLCLHWGDNSFFAYTFNSIGLFKMSGCENVDLTGFLQWNTWCMKFWHSYRPLHSAYFEDEVISVCQWRRYSFDVRGWVLIMPLSLALIHVLIFLLSIFSLSTRISVIVHYFCWVVCGGNWYPNADWERTNSEYQCVCQEKLPASSWRSYTVSQKRCGR